MRGIVFTFDAVFALMIVVIVAPLILLASVDTSSQTINQKLFLQADDAVKILSQMRVADVIKEPVMADLYENGVINSNHFNETLLDFINTLWASNSTVNSTYAKNITEKIFTAVFPENVQWSLLVENDTVFETTPELSKKTTSVSSRVSSGFKKGSPSSGYVASVFLTSLGGKKASSYYFFGGFVGEGNITTRIDSIPADASFKDVYLEMSMGSNITFYINSNYCSDLNKTQLVDNFTINSSTCLGMLNPGQTNNFTFIFGTNDTTKQYVGGGYLRVNYVTSELAPQSINSTRFYLPGIKGAISYFDSIYVPGNITNMSINLHIFNNYSTIFLIGNKTVYNSPGSAADQNTKLNDTYLSSLLNYKEISSTTVPMRLGVNVSNLTLSIQGTTDADIILITDVSGSMDWNFTCSLSSGCLNGVQINNCSDPNLYNKSTRRISLAKCLDKDFVNVILNSGGNNKVGLVNFDGSGDSYVDLTTNQTLLNNTINSYAAGGSTCISCAINRAYSMLQSQGSPLRQKYVILMTDGVANVRSTSTCLDVFGQSSFSSTSPFGAGQSGSIINRNATGWWNSFPSPIATQINDMRMLNSTLGFAVGNSGVIIKWNGTTWATVSSPVASTINGVDILNRTFGLAVGVSGRVLKWDGNSWSTLATIANSPTLNAVSVFDYNLSFIAGTRSSTGRIYMSTNGGVTWNEVNASGSNFRGVKILNSTRAIAVGNAGLVARWNTTTWGTMPSQTTDDLYTIDSFNDTYAFAVGGNNGNSVVVKYNGSAWSLEYDHPADSLHDIVVYNNFSYAVGEDTTIVEFNGTLWNRTFQVPLGYEGNLTSGITCTSDFDTCNEPESFPGLNANYSSCRIYRDINATVNSIGFGPVSNCSFAKKILQSVADCGNGTFYTSDNTTELKNIYASIAQTIISQTYFNQAINITTFGSLTPSIIYPDSYIEINYTPQAPQIAYQEISVNQETDQFNACNYTLYLPSSINVLDAKTTSFSGDLWTMNVSLKSPLTNNKTSDVYLLQKYGSVFQDLGDPFIINLPENIVATGGNSTVSIKLGIAPNNASSICSLNSRIIYTVGLRASAPFGSVFPTLSGGVIRIYYDSNYDGVSDGYTDIIVGASLPNFDPTPRTVDQLDPANNALDDALIRMFTSLNFIQGSGLPGSATNPINVKLSDIDISVAGTGGVPFAWGPIGIKFEVKV